MTTRYERIKIQRRIQRQIRLVVEERRLALALQAGVTAEVETTIEILPPTAVSAATPAQARAIGRVPIGSFLSQA